MLNYHLLEIKSNFIQSYMSTQLNAQIYRSKDGGETWEYAGIGMDQFYNQWSGQNE